MGEGVGAGWIERLAAWVYMGLFFGKKRMGVEGMGGGGEKKEKKGVCDCERRLISVCVDMLEKIQRD